MERYGFIVVITMIFSEKHFVWKRVKCDSKVEVIATFSVTCATFRTTTRLCNGFLMSGFLVWKHLHHNLVLVLQWSHHCCFSKFVNVEITYNDHKCLHCCWNVLKRVYILPIKFESSCGCTAPVQITMKHDTYCQSIIYMHLNVHLVRHKLIAAK